MTDLDLSGEPTPYDTNGPLPSDAPVKKKHLWQTEGVFLGRAVDEPDRRAAAGDPVLFPGDAAANATGPRQAVAGQHNWVPIGPRNVGGRVTCLAVDPGNPAILYAGAASGGVFKSLDGGNSWFALWHAEAALPVGALAVSPSTATKVWAATGQVRPAGAEIIRGNGIYVSTDSGATWTTSGVPGTAPNLGFSFDAIAPHPTNDQICWAVGPAGVFRTTNGGGRWTQFAATAGAYFSDVTFSLSTGNAPMVYLARATSAGGEAVIIRLDAPDAADAAVEAALVAPANQMQVVPPNAALAVGQRPARAKLVVSPSNRNVAYAAYATQSGNVFAVLRCRNARVTPANTASWFAFVRHPEWANEAQVGTNMCLAVSPANSNHVAFAGMELFTATDANVAANPGAPGGTVAITWNRAQAWDLNVIEPGHHADHHALLFVQRGAGPPELWNGNDGGVSLSTDWSTGNAYPNGGSVLPLPAGVTSWTKRSNGLIAPQMYDLTQSPLVPTMMACGHQDNGVFMTDGGSTWQFVMGADGGFVAFDPDDPYRCYATWQGGVDSVEFPGALNGRLPVAGDVIQTALWPRELSQGFLAEDGPLFVAETVHDPFDSGRVLMGRLQRLYGLRRAVQGDVWAPEPVGSGVELFGAIPAVGTVARIDVLASAGARSLGFQPTIGLGRNATGGGAPAERGRLISPWRGPYSFDEGDVLSLRVNGAAVAPAITFRSGGLIADLSNATAAEVAAEINRQAPAALAAATYFPARPTEVEIQTAATAAGISITIGGTLFNRHGRYALGIAPGTYTAPPGGRATVRIPVFEARGGNNLEFADLGVTGAAPALTLTVQITGRQVRTVTFSSAGGFADPTSLRVGELVAALRAALAPDPVHVHPAAATKNVQIAGTAGNLTFAGNAQANLGLPAAASPSGTVAVWWPAAMTLFHTFTITDTAGNVATIRGRAIDFGNPSSVSAAEFATVVTTAITDAGVAAAVTQPGGDVRIAGTAGNLTFGGTALGVLGVAAGPVASVTATPAWPVDLTQPQQLQITDAAGTSVTVNGNAATFQNPAAVYPDEFHQVVGAALVAGGVNASVTFEAAALTVPNDEPRQFAGEATEITFSPTTAGRVWVGGMGGELHASDDDGNNWRTIRWPAMTHQDRRVEAIAFHPTRAGTVYVGLYGERKDLSFWAAQEHFLGTGPNDPGFLFRTEDDGVTFEHVGAQIVDAGAPASLVSINALETDPAAPDDVYAATNIGVFVSNNRGDSWQPFNEGLPNAWVRDLAFEPTTRMLRAGVWGRGVFERHVGSVPSRDVQLYVRANELDMGHDRPPPRGVSPLSPSPAAVGPTSPDIKVTRSAPARFTEAGAFVDGVDMDRWITHEPVTPGEADVFVQVHNRGAFPASGVRLVAMFADATHGLPPLAELFWIDHAGGPLAGTNGEWTVIGDHTLADPGNIGADRVTAEMPRVHRFHLTFPADVGDMDTIGILLIADCVEDPNDASETDIAKLIDSSRMVAYRESATAHPDDDHLLLVRGVNGQQFSVAPSPTASALQRLGWTAGVGPVTSTTAGSEPFDLRPPGATGRGIRVSEPAITLNLSVRSTATDFAGVTTATSDEMRDFLDAAFLQAGVPVRISQLGVGGLPPYSIRLDGRGGALVAVTGGTLQAALGLPMNPAAAQVQGANNEPFALAAAGGNNTLTVQITPQRDIRFVAADFANLQTATAREVRAVINREAQLGQLEVRAEIPRAVLRVRGSITDVEGPEATLGGAHLADLVAGGTSVVDPGDQPGLFDLLTVHGTDRLTADTDNFLYLRVTNAGNIDATNAQVRLYAVTVGDVGDPTDVEVDLTQIDANPTPAGPDAALTVPAGGQQILEVPWDPGPAEAGDRRWVLAVVNVAGRPIDVPATFDDFAAFHTFAARRRGAAYRTFEVDS